MTTGKKQLRAKAPILELEALEPQEHVRVDGNTYDMANYTAFGLRARSEVARLVKRLLALEAIDAPSEEDEAEYSQRLTEICRIAFPDLKRETLDKLDVGQRGDLAGAFFVPLLDRPGMRMVQDVKARASARSSPSSNGSSPLSVRTRG